jgi:hypothetical protein
MTPEMISSIVNKASSIATNHAMHGTPLAAMAWIPPRTPTDDPEGMFAIKYAEPFSAADTPPWLK